MATRILNGQEKIKNSQRAKKQMKKASEYLSNLMTLEYDLTTDEKNDLMYMVLQVSKMKQRQNLIIEQNGNKVGYYNVS